MRNKVSSVLIFTMLGLLSCGEEQHMEPMEPVYFKMTMMNERGLETTVFEKGEEVIMALSIVNHSGNEFKVAGPSVECFMVGKEDFMYVYKRSIGVNGILLDLPVGRPYQDQKVCPLMLWYKKIPVGETSLVSVPWSNNPSNEPLEAGLYYSAFPVTLEIGGKTQTWQLRKEFRVR